MSVTHQSKQTSLYPSNQSIIQADSSQQKSLYHYSAHSPHTLALDFLNQCNLNSGLKRRFIAVSLYGENKDGMMFCNPELK